MAQGVEAVAAGESSAFRCGLPDEVVEGAAQQGLPRLLTNSGPPRTFSHTDVTNHLA